MGTATKHDPEICGRRNVANMEKFPPDFPAGDMSDESKDYRLPNSVFNTLRTHSNKEEKLVGRAHSSHTLHTYTPPHTHRPKDCTRRRSTRLRSRHWIRRHVSFSSRWSMLECWRRSMDASALARRPASIMH